MIDPTIVLESARNGDRWYPYAAQMPIPEANFQAIISSRLFILHSMAGPNLTTLDNIYRYYKRDDVHTESTLASDMEGRVAQFVPINVRADCNAQANPFATSIESQDNGYPSLPWTSWTAPQFEQHAAIAMWMYINPLVSNQFELTAAPCWNCGGVGYHSQYSQWSIYTGKTCPGAARIAQTPFVIARAKELYYWALDEEHAPPAPTNPFPIMDTLEDQMKLDYNGMVLEYDGFRVKRVISGRVANISAIKSIDKASLIDLMKESKTIKHPAHPYPFQQVPGYEDNELHFWWVAAEQNPA